MEDIEADHVKSLQYCEGVSCMQVLLSLGVFVLRVLLYVFMPMGIDEEP